MGRGRDRAQCMTPEQEELLQLEPKWILGGMGAPASEGQQGVEALDSPLPLVGPL